MPPRRRLPRLLETCPRSGFERTKGSRQALPRNASAPRAVRPTCARRASTGTLRPRQPPPRLTTRYPTSAFASVCRPATDDRYYRTMRLDYMAVVDTHGFDHACARLGGWRERSCP